MNNELTRRRILGKASIYGSALTLATGGGLPKAFAAAAKSKTPDVLTKAEWCTVEAMTGRHHPFR